MQSVVLLCALALSASTLCSSCGIYERGLGQHDKDIVVNKHNELRQQVAQGRVPGQPKATNMKWMRYDEALAKQAQQLTDSCTFAHQKFSDGRWHAVGQNLYISMSTAYGPGADWSNAIKTWFDEYKYYSYGGPVNSQNGHYTQLVWADSEFVGCGYTYYETNENFQYKKLYACNYGPAGNYVGQTPYKT